MYDATFKIIIFGDAGCGKTTLTQRFLTNLFVSDQTMTIGVDFEVKSLSVDDQKVKLQIWDFGGEDMFRFLLPIYSKGSSGGIFMYDLSRPQTLNNMDVFIDLFKQGLEEDKRDVPILLVGGKLDLVNNRDEASENARNLIESRNLCNCIECSAISGENVEHLFELLIENILANEKLFK